MPEFKHLNYSYTTKKLIEWNLPRIPSENKKALLTNFDTRQMLPFGKIYNVEYWIYKNSGDKIKLNTEKNS